MLHDPSHVTPVPVEQEIRLTPKEKEVLKALGGEIAQIASLPIHKEKARLWTNLNDLQSKRPMVWINEIPWHEMNVDDELTLRTSHPWARELEDHLRQDDLPVDGICPATWWSAITSNARWCHPQHRFRHPRGCGHRAHRRRANNIVRAISTIQIQRAGGHREDPDARRHPTTSDATRYGFRRPCGNLSGASCPCARWARRTSGTRPGTSSSAGGASKRP